MRFFKLIIIFCKFQAKTESLLTYGSTQSSLESFEAIILVSELHNLNIKNSVIFLTEKENLEGKKI